MIRPFGALLLLVLLVSLFVPSAVAQPQPGTEKSYSVKIYISADQDGEKSEATCTGSLTLRVQNVTNDTIEIYYSLVIDRCDVKGNKTVIEDAAGITPLGSMVKAVEEGKYTRNGTKTYRIDEKPDPDDIKYYVSPSMLPENRTVANTSSIPLAPGYNLTVSGRNVYDENGLLEEAQHSIELTTPEGKTVVRVEIEGSSPLASIIYLAVITLIVLAIAGGLVLLARRI